MSFWLKLPFPGMHLWCWSRTTCTWNIMLVLWLKNVFLIIGLSFIVQEWEFCNWLEVTRKCKTWENIPQLKQFYFLCPAKGSDDRVRRSIKTFFVSICLPRLFISSQRCVALGSLSHARIHIEKSLLDSSLLERLNLEIVFLLVEHQVNFHAV